MNPWMCQQLGAAHRSELRRVAAEREAARSARLKTRSTSSGGPMTRGQDRGWPATRPGSVGRARVAVGVLLVRAGSRLAGGAGALAG